MTFPDTLRYRDRINIHNFLSTSLHFGGFVEMVVGHADSFVAISSEVAHRIVLVIIEASGIEVQELGDSRCFRERGGINHFQEAGRYPRPRSTNLNSVISGPKNGGNRKDRWGWLDGYRDKGSGK